MADEIDWSKVEENDTVSWRGRHTGVLWGRVHYLDGEHVHVFGASISRNNRYRVPRSRVIYHAKGRAEYDQHRF